MSKQVMSITDMRNRIIAFPDKDCGRGATAEEIRAAERSLGVSFSQSYRSFLAEFGWGRFSHQELYGLGSDTPSYLELVKMTLLERSEMVPAVPSYLVPVMNDGAGNHYCLNTTRLEDGECPIVFWDHEQRADQVPYEVARSFDRWLVELLSELSPV